MKGHTPPPFCPLSPLYALPPTRTPVQDLPALRNARPRGHSPLAALRSSGRLRYPAGKGAGQGDCGGRGGWPAHHVTPSCGRAPQCSSPAARAQAQPGSRRRAAQAGGRAWVSFVTGARLLLRVCSTSQGRACIPLLATQLFLSRNQSLASASFITIVCPIDKEPRSPPLRNL